MTNNLFDKKTLRKNRMVIGMLHMPALPGSPLNNMSLTQITDVIIQDALTLTKGGVTALMMENFGDVPFFPGRVPATVVAMMTAVAIEVRRISKLPLGINVLRNDGLSALSIAKASGASFIRVNVLSGARVTDQGVIQGIAHDLMRLRKDLDALNIKVMADIDVKHSAPLAARNLVDELEDTIHRGLADAVIISGSGTGKSVDLDKLKLVAKAKGSTPLFLGSGVSADSIDSLIPLADGFIVGTSLKENNIVSHPVDLVKVKQLMAKLTSAR